MKGEENNEEYKRIYDEIYNDSRLSDKRLFSFGNDFGFTISPEKGREDASQAIASMMCNQAIFDEVYSKFDEGKKKLLQNVANGSPVPVYEAYQDTGLEIPLHSDFDNNYYTDRSNEKGTEHFPYLFRSDRRIISLGPNVRKALRKRLPERTASQKIDEETFLSSGNIFTEEKGFEIFSHLDELINYCLDENFFNEENSLAYYRKYILELYEKFGISEFYPTVSYTAFVSNKRGKILLYILQAGYNYAKENNEKNIDSFDSPLETMMAILKYFCMNCSYDFCRKFIVPNNMALKCNSPDFEARLHEGLKHYMEEIGRFFGDRIISFDEYLQHFIDEGLGFMPDDRNAYKYEDWGWEYIDSNGSKDKDLFSYYIERRSLVNMVYVLTAIGLIEVSSEVNDRILSNREEYAPYYCYGKPIYMRLTELGKEVFNLKESSCFDLKNNSKRPVLLETEPVIKLDEKDSIYKNFIEGWTQKISDNYYLADQEKMLECFSSEEEMEEAFDRLSRLSGKELPEFWQKLRDKLRKNLVFLEAKIQKFARVDLNGLDDCVKDVALDMMQKHAGQVFMLENNKILIQYELKYEFRDKVLEKGIGLHMTYNY